MDKLYHSARFRGPGSAEGALTIQTGTFDPLLGRSYHQLAMESRSMHRSQEMGAEQALGDRTTGIRLVQSRVGGIESDTGIFAAPEGGAVAAAVPALIAMGALDRDEEVLLFNTGSGLKYVGMSPVS